MAENTGEDGKNRYFVRWQSSFNGGWQCAGSGVRIRDSYAMVRITREAVTVEEYLPKESSFEAYTYPAPNNPEDKYSYHLYYFGAHCFAAVDSYREAENYRDELCFFVGE